MLPLRFDIARARPADLDDLERIERECFEADRVFSRRQLRDLLRSPLARVWVLRHEGRVAADAITLRMTASNPGSRRGRRGVPSCSTGRIYSLAVLPEHRGKGFGKALLGACLEDLLSAGAGAVRLEVGVDNVSAVALYEAFGFSKTGRIPDYYAPGLDAWRMRLEP